MKRYRAVLTGNLRDLEFQQPKVLLLNIVTPDGAIFRDHSWVDRNYFTDIPKGHSKFKWLIEFDAKEKEYKSSEGLKKKLVKITNIKILNRRYTWK